MDAETKQRITFLKVAIKEANKMAFNRSFPDSSRNKFLDKAEKYQNEIDILKNEGISKKTLNTIDKSMENLAKGKAGEPIDFEKLKDVVEG